MTQHGTPKKFHNGVVPQRDDWNPVGPRGGARPVNTMNILLTIGIFLQIYQIYRTPTHSFGNNNYNSQGFLQQPGSASFYDFRKSFGDSLQNPLQLQDASSLYQEPAFLEPFANTDDANYDRQAGRTRSRLMLYGGDYESAPDFRPDAEQLQLQQNWTIDDDEVKNSNRTDDAYTPFQYPKYNYSLPAQKTNWTLTSQPSPSNESNLAVIVISGRSNFERRQTIRETWAQNHTNVYFIIGGPEPDNLQDKDWNNINSTSNRLFREQETYQDILDTIHPDTYKGLCYKVHYAIQWISQHPGMKHIQWVLKADDDVVVRQNALQHYVLRKFHPQTPLVIGRIEPNSQPHRVGKWAEDPKWSGIEGVDEYPPWAYGSTGYVMSRPVLDYVASETSLYYYQGEVSAVCT
jgi:Galactosyltransferase